MSSIREIPASTATATSAADAIGWAATAREASLDDAGVSPFPRDVDVVIVGAGYTGLSAALRLAEHGRSVVVVEAGRVGGGAAGRNVGLVNAGVWLPPDAVRAKMGDAPARRFLEIFGDAPRRVFDLIERWQIQCDATQVGSFHAATGPAGLRELRARAEAWRALGAEVRLLDRPATANAVGSDAFLAALKDPRAGALNPLAFCRGLARAARSAGAVIVEDAPARGMVRDQGRWRVRTDRGDVSAPVAALCVNAYADALWPGLSRSFVPIDYVQASTEPLGAAAARILPGGQGLWTTAKIMTSLRCDRDGRLIVGTMGAAHGDAARGLTRRWAERTLRRLFPFLDAITIDAVWSGRIAMTSAHLPRILQLDDGLFAPTAYNGRGVTTGVVFGEAIADLAMGGGDAVLPAPLTSLRREPLRGLRRVAFRGAFAAHQTLGAFR